MKTKRLYLFIIVVLLIVPSIIENGQINYYKIKEAFNMFFEEADSEDELFEASLVKISKNENYAEFIVPRFSDKTFKTHFRINPCVFEVLCTELNLIIYA